MPAQRPPRSATTTPRPATVWSRSRGSGDMLVETAVEVPDHDLAVIVDRDLLLRFLVEAGYQPQRP